VSVKRRTFTFVVLALLVWALVASLTSAYYFYLYSNLFQKTRKPIIHLNLGFNYGNGTVQWFNQTEARGGDTLLDITMQVAKVNHTIFSYGAFVNSINNVNNTASKAWIWWTWTQQFGWSQGPIASDRYALGDDETAYWYYQDVSAWPYSTPP